MERSNALLFPTAAGPWSVFPSSLEIIMNRHFLAIGITALAFSTFIYFADSGAKSPSFQAHLTGQSVYPASKTLAQGDATFELNRAGDALTFTITVSAIENITEAHIHTGSKGDSLGQVLVTLYSDEVRPGRTDGVLARGTIKSSDLKGPLMDQPLSALVGLIADGLTYVDVHTEQLPGGEIRGQIQ